jgi:hypothetical protein
MQERACSGRADDTGKISDALVQLITKDPSQPILGPNPLPKYDRGFNHPRTAELLCPAKFIKQYQRDPKALVFVSLNHLCLTECL